MDASRIWDIAQYCNSVLVFVTGVGVHISILLGLIYRSSPLNHYHYLILLQSTIDIIAITSCFLTNERILLNGVSTWGHTFIGLDSSCSRYTMFSNYMMETLEGTIIAIFNIHRTFIIVSYRHMKTFYVIVTPVLLAFALFNGYQQAFYIFPQYVSAFIAYSPFLIASIVAGICHFVIKAYFNENGCSGKVKELQSKLTTGILLQFANMICNWNTVATAIVIRWSIAGFFRRRKISTIAFPSSANLKS
ncbi:unnamed protein product [Nippostrongylus brasiliensis]|uniref:G protein-coupled receptor n=1 Tax=Nippostrongylus brasiliensis TaxID=27835 RepID=A0A0N4YC42_NIPBR|nr:unnamed protein product [Nippostrongylus brasiliensis]